MENRSDLLPAFFSLGVAAMFLVVGLAISIVVCWLLYGCYNRVPAEHRKLAPGLVWLLLIPCFPIVWNFFVYPQLARSYRSYFASVGRTDVGDCGEMLAWAFCGCVIGSVIPFLGVVIALAALVLWILFLVKALTLKGQIPA